MEKLTATYNDETVYIWSVSKFIEYCLVSYNSDQTGMFKLNVSELKGVTEKELLKMLQHQEYVEQMRAIEKGPA